MSNFKDNLKKMWPWLIVAFATVILFETLEHLDVVGSYLSQVISVVMPFLVGLALAWLVDIPARKLESIIHIRWLSVVITLICVVAIVYLLGAMVVPQVQDSAEDFANNMSNYVDNLKALLVQAQIYLDRLPFATNISIDATINNALKDWEGIWSNVTEFASAYSESIFAYGKAIGNGLATTVIAIFAMLFILLEKEHLVHSVKKIGKAVFSEKFYIETVRIWRLSDKMLSGFLTGKFLDSLIIGVITAIVMSLFHMPLVALISVIVTITNIIPVVGPFIGGGIGGVLLLFVSPKSLLPFIVMMFIIQQVDGNVIGPKVLGDNVGMPTIWTLFAIIVGGKLFGLVGMVLGVPIFAVIYTLIREFVTKQLIAKGYSDMLLPTPGEQRRIDRRNARKAWWNSRKKSSGQSDETVEPEAEAQKEAEQRMDKQSSDEIEQTVESEEQGASTEAAATKET